MGKKNIKAVRDSAKISKSSSDNKTNLHSLIKNLKPKVYITESSAFKKLVQDLTGNGNGCTIVSTTPSPISSPPYTITSSESTDHEQDQDQDLSSFMFPNNISIDDYANFQEIMSSPELSFDSSSEGLSFPTAFACSQDINMPVMTETNFAAEFQSCFDMVANLPQYGGGLIDEESSSWFLEMDHNLVSNYDCSYTLPTMMPPEVCVYDYDLSAIM